MDLEGRPYKKRLEGRSRPDSNSAAQVMRPGSSNTSTTTWMLLGYRQYVQLMSYKQKSCGPVSPPIDFVRGRSAGTRCCIYAQHIKSDRRII